MGAPASTMRTFCRFGSKRRFDANLQKLRILKDGVAVRAYVCTRCLKAGKVQRAL